MGNALLGFRLRGSRWLRRQLQHCRRLPLAQMRQHHDLPIGEFERIVVCRCGLLVDLSKDRRPGVDCPFFPTEQASRGARNWFGKSQFRSRHYTNCNSKMIRGGEAACASARPLTFIS
jgi:hypothetical protein